MFDRVVEIFQSLCCYLVGHSWSYLTCVENHGEPHLTYQVKYRNCDRCPALHRGDVWHEPSGVEHRPSFWSTDSYSLTWTPATGKDWDNIMRAVDSEPGGVVVLPHIKGGKP